MRFLSERIDKVCSQMYATAERKVNQLSGAVTGAFECFASRRPAYVRRSVHCRPKNRTLVHFQTRHTYKSFPGILTDVRALRSNRFYSPRKASFDRNRAAAPTVPSSRQLLARRGRRGHLVLGGDVTEREEATRARRAYSSISLWWYRPNSRVPSFRCERRQGEQQTRIQK